MEAVVAREQRSRVIQTSLDYQERFAEAVPELVEGKSIDAVELDRVAGASGTPDDFNDALEKIKDEATE